MIRLKLPSAKETVEYASTFIRRTIPQAEYWITNRHRWMHNIPTEECDVVITFQIGIEELTFMWLLSRLKTTGLNVRVRHNAMTNCYQCYLTAPMHVLLKCAEEHHLPKRLNSDYGGGLKEFVSSEENKFQGFESEMEFFTMQERQWLILQLLETLRTQTYEEIGNVKFIEGQAIIPKCLSSNIIAQIYPVHEMHTLKYLRKTWVRSIFNKQPINEIAEYFGVKIAMYFAWLGHYTRSLTIPAVVGFIFWIISFFRIDQSIADIGFVLFSFFNVIWFSIYLEAWKRYCAELAYKWGTLDQRDELLVEPRPLFTGSLEISSVTGRLEPKYPAWKRNVFRYFVSIPIIGVCVCIVVGIMILNFKLQNWWDKKILERNYFLCFTFGPKILLGIVISFLDAIYYKVARWLNDKENYRLNREYENNLITKVATFQFVNSFISLFYIAFYLQDQERLKIQLAVLLITRQIIQNIKESALPYLIEQFRLAKLSFDLFGALSPSVVKEKCQFSDHCKHKDRRKQQSEYSTIPQAEVESTLFKYEGTFSEHLEMFIQLGYVVLFSSAFPMAALCAFINNLIEIRSDAFKMCFIYQRPFGERVSNIGMWLNTMKIMGLIAILVNCALIGLSGQVHRMFPDMSKTQTILLIVALEHFMLLVRFLISCLIPDKPEWVATEIAKVEFARREAVNRVSSATTTPPSSATAVTISTNTDFNNKISNKIMKEEFTSSLECLNDKSSDESEMFEVAMETDALSTDYTDTVELDLSQSIDNIDRILRNIGEEREEPIAIKRGSSKESESSGDIGIPVTYVSGKGKKGNAKISSPKSVCREKDLCLNAEETLNRPANSIHYSGSWYRNLNTRRLVGNIEKNYNTWRSTSCIPSVQKYSNLSNELNSPTISLGKPAETTKSEASSAAEEISVADPVEKKKKLRSTLIKRARSVAVFSLKLKEKRAKAELKESENLKDKISPKNENIMVGGELSCVPIEMLISIDDVNLQMLQQKKKSFSSNSK